jgi:hypothetical protein
LWFKDLKIYINKEKNIKFNDCWEWTVITKRKGFKIRKLGCEKFQHSKNYSEETSAILLSSYCVVVYIFFHYSYDSFEERKKTYIKYIHINNNFISLGYNTKYNNNILLFTLALFCMCEASFDVITTTKNCRKERKRS